MSRRGFAALAVGCVALFGASFAAAQVTGDQPTEKTRSVPATPAAPGPTPANGGRTLALAPAPGLPELTRKPRPRPKPAPAVAIVPTSAPAAAPAPSPPPSTGGGTPAPESPSTVSDGGAAPQGDTQQSQPATPQPQAPTEFYDAG